MSVQKKTGILPHTKKTFDRRWTAFQVRARPPRGLDTPSRLRPRLASRRRDRGQRSKVGTCLPYPGRLGSPLEPPSLRRPRDGSRRDPESSSGAWAPPPSDEGLGPLPPRGLAAGRRVRASRGGAATVPSAGPSALPNPGSDPGPSALLTGSQRLHGGGGGRLAPVPRTSRSGPRRRRRRRVTLALRNIGAEVAPRGRER